jgi:hypothetical protein
MIEKLAHGLSQPILYLFDRSSDFLNDPLDLGMTAGLLGKGLSGDILKRLGETSVLA